MATDIGAEGVLPPITQEKPKTTPAQPLTETGGGLAGLLKKLLRKKEPAKEFTDTTAQIAQHRNDLSSLATFRSDKVPADDPVELSHLNAITELGGNLTAEELHRKAILVAQNEADANHRSLRPEDVPLVEQRLREKQSAKASSPEPAGAGTKS